MPSRTHGTHLARTLLAAALLVLGVGAAPATPASAALINVTMSSDTVANDAACSLREAVNSANQNSLANAQGCNQAGDSGGADFIELEPTVYALSGAASEDANASGDLDPAPTAGSPITVDGAGINSTTLDGQGVDRVINNVGNGALTLSGFTLVNGVAPDGEGGGGVLGNTGSTLALSGVDVSGNGAAIPSGTGVAGAGVFADGSLSLANSIVSGNTAQNSGGAGIAHQGSTNVSVTSSTIVANNLVKPGAGIGGTVPGGGIAMRNGGTLTVTDSEIRDNSVTVGNALDFPAAAGLDVDDADLSLTGSTVAGNTLNGGNASLGGGLLFHDPTTPSGDNKATILNSTFAGNTAPSGAGPSTSEGGAMSISGGQSTLTHATLSGNSAPTGSAMRYGVGGQSNSTLTLRGAIVDGGPDACLANSIASTGYNIDRGTSCGLSNVNDLQSTDPQLAPLGDYGGPTRTMLPLSGSPALNRIPQAFCLKANLTPLSDDQRHQSRPSGGTCDIGSVERQPGDVDPAPPPPPPPAKDTTAPNTTIDKGPKKKSHKRKPKFVFSADESSSFQCKLDRKPFAPCTPPFKPSKKLKRGKHSFQVEATDQAGNTDASPAVVKFKVK